MNAVKDRECMRDQLENCTFIKTILMVLVVLYHSCLFFGESHWINVDPIYVSPVLSVFAGWLNTFHIYAFTMISGYIFYYKKREQNGYRHGPAFFRGKAQRLIVPYVFGITCWIIPTHVFLLKENVGKIFKNCILGVRPDQLWYLSALFGMFVLFYFFFDFFEKNNVAGGIAVCVLWGIGFIGHRYVANYFQIWSIPMSAIYFWIGIKVRQYGIGARECAGGGQTF